MSVLADEDDEAMRPAEKLVLGQRLAVSMLLLIPLLLMSLKMLGPPYSAFLENLSFSDMHHQTAIGHVLFVPVAGLLVTIFRLTLGIRVLGPFRPILIAFSFELTGILPGIFFLVITVAIFMTVRPAIRRLRMPYFGRITMLLSVVAVLIAVAIFIAKSFHLQHWSGMAHFPIVVLCLISEAFAQSIKTEGLRCGLWRGSMTILVAVLLTLMAENDTVRQVLLRYPELMIMQLGMITIISRTCAWRLLQGLNPPAKNRRNRTAPRSPDSAARTSKDTTEGRQNAAQTQVPPSSLALVSTEESANSTADGPATVRRIRRNNNS